MIMTRKSYNHRPQANPCHRDVNTDHRQLHNNRVRLHFYEMFRNIFPEVGDLAPVCVCECVCLVNSLGHMQPVSLLKVAPDKPKKLDNCR